MHYHYVLGFRRKPRERPPSQLTEALNAEASRSRYAVTNATCSSLKPASVAMSINAATPPRAATSPDRPLRGCATAGRDLDHQAGGARCPASGRMVAWGWERRAASQRYVNSRNAITRNSIDGAHVRPGATESDYIILSAMLDSTN